MRLRLQRGLTPQPEVSDPNWRIPSESDQSALASLMLDSYRGTVDDSGETLADAQAEIQRLWSGDYGEFLPAASRVYGVQGRVVSAALVTRYEGSPLLAFSMTAPDWKRRGLARQGICQAINALLADGELTLRLVVTEGNTAALRLYHSLGFDDAPA